MKQTRLILSAPIGGQLTTVIIARDYAEGVAQRNSRSFRSYYPAAATWPKRKAHRVDEITGEPLE
jgi:hypothetical protein